MRTVALWLAMTTAALAQTAPVIPQTGRSATGTPVTSRADLQGLFGTKMDSTQLNAYLGAGQTIGQMTSGAINATPIITAALAAYGSVLLPCGTYRLDGPITVNSRSIHTENASCVIISVNFTAGDVFVFPSTSLNASIDGFTVNTVSAHTIGALFHSIGSTGTTIRGTDAGYAALFDTVRLDNAAQDAGSSAPTAQFRFENARLGGASGSCFTLAGNAQDILISGVVTIGCKSAFIITYASGIHISHVDSIASQGDAFIVAPATGQNVNALYVTDVEMDSSVGTGWNFGGTGPITEVFLTNAWAAQSGVTGPLQGTPAALANPASGFWLHNPAINGFTMIAAQAHRNNCHGVLIDSGKNINISGGSQIFDNGMLNGQTSSFGVAYAATTCDGIRVNDGADMVTIVNSSSGAGGFDQQDIGTVNRQANGIQASGMSSTRRLILANNTVVGNVYNGIAPPPAVLGASMQITGNVGYNPVGAKTVTLGSSPFLYVAGPSPETMYIFGPGTSLVIANGTNTGVINGSVNLGPGENVQITYSGGTPTVNVAVH